MVDKKTQTWALGAALLASVAMPAGAATTVFSGVGADAASIQGNVDAFRAALGANNGLGACATADCLAGLGRREINWDAVPDSASAPNAFPGNFFNQATGAPAGRIRGANFTTSGSFAVSADSDSDNDGVAGPLATEFGNLNSQSADQFAAFSAERIFGLLGTNTMDVLFDVAGAPGTAAKVRGFGVVFTDVEVLNSTKLEFFDGQNQLLHTALAPAFPFVGSDSFGSFSFVGVMFDAPVVARVHITSGDFDAALVPVPGGAGSDAVAMDDFIYGEPTVVPLPPAVLLLGSSLLGLGLARRRRI